MDGSYLVRMAQKIFDFLDGSVGDARGGFLYCVLFLFYVEV